MKYRSEIDGLRALAVVPVILFHGGFPGFHGGYVGVDVFFVISGFLITGILADDLAQGRFSLITFYERRARRILPALFFVMLACIPFAWAWFVPRDFVDFAESIVATATFWSNVLFWLETGYFATDAELKPLLHTWSLSVEEQFYVLFPLLLWGLWHRGQRTLVAVLAAVLLASLALAEWAVIHAPSAAYFMLPMRAWELMVGALAALAVRSGKLRFARGVEEALGLAGLILILYAVTAFNWATPVPGLPALIPVLGTVLVLLPAASPTVAHRMLSLPPVVGLGLVSYSAYLWHQPLFAFARYHAISAPAEMPGLLMPGLVVLTFGLAYLSWRYVEAPFRSSARISRRAVFGGSAAFGAVFCAFGAAVLAYDGLPSRLNLPESVVASIARSDREDACFDKPGLHEIEDWTCPLGAEATPPRFLVFGDSHALSLREPLDSAARETGISGEFSGASGCTPFLGIHALRKDQVIKNCHAANARLLRYALERQIKHVILIARWSYYTDGDYSGEFFSYIGRAPDAAQTQAESRAAFEEGLVTTLNAYRDAGIRLTLIAQIPQQMRDPIHAYAEAYTAPHPPGETLSTLSVTRERHLDLQAFANAAFARHGAPVLDFTEILCGEAICPLGTLTTSYYFDDDHLSLIGANRLLPQLRTLLE